MAEQLAAAVLPEETQEELSFANGVTPIDEATGLPFPIYPNPDLPPPLRRGEKNLERIGDRHHAFHPRAALIGHGMGAEAIRHSRIQWTEYSDHGHYHAAFGGPPLPDTPLAQYRTAVFAAAGYVPDRAIAFERDGSPKDVRLSADMRMKLVRSGALRAEDEWKIKAFLLEYAVKSGLPSINDELLIDEFLHTDNVTRRTEIGSFLIQSVSELATNPFSDDYTEARNLRLVPPERSRRVGKFVANLIMLRPPGEVSSKAITTLHSLVRASMKQRVKRLAVA